LVALSAADPSPWWRGVWRRPEVRLVISLGILALLLTLFPVDQLWAAVRGVRPAVWLGCLAVFVAGHAVGAWKWRLLISMGGARAPYGSVFRIYFAGLFANLFLPSIAGGDVVRAGLAMRGSERKNVVVLGSVLDRLFDTLALVILVLVGSGLSEASLAPSERNLVLAIGASVPLAALIVAVSLALPLPAWVPAAAHAIRDKLRGAMRYFVRHIGTALVAFTLSVAIQALFVGVAATVGRDCGIDLPLAVWLFVWPLAKLVAMAPVSLGGLGVREAALALLFGRFGVPAAQAVGVGLLWQTLIVAAGLFGGLFYAMGRRVVPSPDAETS